MAYIHEAQALKAMKNLYMLGNQRYRGGKSGPMSEAAGAVGGMVEGMAKDQDTAQKKSIMSNAIKQQSDLYNKQQIMAQAIQKAQMQQAIDAAKQAQQQAKINDAATNTQIGGSFTRSGFEDHARQTDRKVWDIDQSKRLIHGGMGMSDPMIGR